MRTTLSLDDDIAAKLQEETRRGQTSFKAVVNDCLRRGLSERVSTSTTSAGCSSSSTGRRGDDMAALPVSPARRG